MTAVPVFVHATALVVGERGVLIRGPSGAGKSRLALLLIAEAARRHRFARLVADDRVALAACHGRLLARPHPAIAGLVEQRFAGIKTIPHEPACVVRCVVDLVASPLPRLPDPADCRTDLLGIPLPRLAFPAGHAGVDAAAVLDRLLGPEPLIELTMTGAADPKPRHPEPAAEGG